MRFLERPVRRLAVALALLGGVALTALTIITVLSVTGRALVWAGLGPVPGDFELVEAGTGFAVFAFLAWCHFNREHAQVEILTMRFSPFANRIIDLVVDALMLVVACVLAYQHYLGMLDKIAYSETSFILRFPIWWAYAASLLGAVAFVIVAVYCLLASISAVAAGDTDSAERPAS